jgi:hypothetical protein
MLVLHREDTRNKFKEAFGAVKEQLGKLLRKTFLTFSKVKYFSRFNSKTKKREVTLIYLEIEKDQQFQKVVHAADIFIRSMLKNEIIANSELKQMRIVYDHNENLYRNEEYHLTLFRVKDVAEDEHFEEIFKQISQMFKSQVFECGSLEISTRNHYDPSGFYAPFDQIDLK